MTKFRDILAVFAIVPVVAAAQQLPMNEPVPSMDVFRTIILQVGETQSGWTVCLDGDTMGTVVDGAEVDLKERGVTGLPTPRQLLTTLRSRFPCPFAPNRAKVRPAQAKDLEGTWVMPQESGTLRYPPNSPQRRQYAAATQAAPFRCLAVGYFPGGEARDIEVRGESATCPAGPADFAAARKAPRTTSWKAAGGKLTLTRSDMGGQAEEWDAFVLEEPFDFVGHLLEAGDVVQYLRKLPGRETDGYAIEFRHLKRLR